ncbi:MAG TPA: hypothetical protein VJ866_09640 [Pyrinomonadaceae bacterium]|nr:hypothetical protein [Pyrinomonadaceae bacterium]
MDILNVVSTIVVIAATGINLYFLYKNHQIADRNTRIADRNLALASKIDQSKRPVIDIKLNCLPPYKSVDQKTILKLKNVGTKETGENPYVLVSCSWMPRISYKMNFPSSSYKLDMNEEIIWKFRMDENYTPNSTVAVHVADVSGSKVSWDLHEQL